METQTRFSHRHLGLNHTTRQSALKALGLRSTEELIERTLPDAIRFKAPLNLPAPAAEHEALDELRAIAKENEVFRSLIGMGYYGTVTPPVILRQIVENPNWYTAYTPYQAEIAQGRLELLLAFQTMVAELTGMDIANASLLDEATAAAEAMTLAHRSSPHAERMGFFVASGCHPQTIDVIHTRAEPLGIKVVVRPVEEFTPEAGYFGALFQYPESDGRIVDLADTVQRAKAAGICVTVATDLLALTVLPPPGEFGADIVIGSSQRFGVPLGFGGPHAAFMGVKDQLKRQMPGRVVGVSKDTKGRPAYRLALQTREQHIRREKATSNICTAQVLLAVTATAYAIYHGPEGLTAIANRVHTFTTTLAHSLQSGGFTVRHQHFFDTLRVEGGDLTGVRERCEKARLNLRWFADGSVGLSLDEETTEAELATICTVFGVSLAAAKHPSRISRRSSEFLKHEVFHRYRSETELLRYLHRLETRDLSLTTSMIALGSCTMKLNAASEMIPVTWAQFGGLHPFAPQAQTKGYQRLFADLERWLCEVTGFDSVSLQPNAGSQGEYAGLLAIRRYHLSRGDAARKVCLIPESAHGTNPATAAMTGMTVVAVKCDAHGNVDVQDLRTKAEAHKAELAALMITYPSTHGVFEEQIREIADIVHANGGQVYMDGANLNAQVGLSRPAQFGMDVCHMNLHKTFCIPHGGGGPGMGPIAVKSHLAPFLPGHFHLTNDRKTHPYSVSAAPWGSPSILVIPWMYIRMMGGEGLKQATEDAILNANYVAHRLDPHFPILYRGKNGFIAHECIVDIRQFQKTAGVDVTDVAKRLMDYGFHAPTVAFPVAGTMMIEPTESESLAELDRFCDAMIQIREEIRQIESGAASKDNNPLKNAPHTADEVTATEWHHPYSREEAAYPLTSLREYKYWPPVSRIDSAYGDRNLVCSCVGMEAYR